MLYLLIALLGVILHLRYSYKQNVNIATRTRWPIKFATTNMEHLSLPIHIGEYEDEGAKKRNFLRDLSGEDETVYVIPQKAVADGYHLFLAPLWPTVALVVLNPGSLGPLVAYPISLIVLAFALRHMCYLAYVNVNSKDRPSIMSGIHNRNIVEEGKEALAIHLESLYERETSLLNIGLSEEEMRKAIEDSRKRDK